MYQEQKDLSWESVERLDWHLWLLAILLIFVLGVSLLGFMLPSVFWAEHALPMQSPQRAFFGFCILLALVLVYLMQRQAAVRSLKRQLFEAQAAIVKAEREAVIHAFLDLPSTLQYRDALAMEYRRASVSGEHLAKVVIKAPNFSLETWGSLVKLLRPMLRSGESMYRISDDEIAVVLPGMQLSDAASFAARLEELSGTTKGEIKFDITGYPDTVASLTELEAPFAKKRLTD